MTEINHGGITITDGLGDGFHLSRLIGWYDAAPTKYEAEDRPQGHGTHRPGTVYRGARVITVEGSWSGRNIVDAYRARRQLAALPAGETPFRVTDPLDTTSVMGSLAKAPRADDEIIEPFFKFDYDLVTYDPFRYSDGVTAASGVPTASSGLSWPRGTTQIGDPEGDGLISTDGYTEDPQRPGWYLTDGLVQDANGLYVPRTTASTPYWDWGTEGNSGRVSVFNEGTADTYSTFEVTGGLDGGFLLTWVPTGAEIRFTRAIPVGSIIYLNPWTGRASIDGQSDVTGSLVKSEWWPVGPDQAGEVQFTPLGAVTGNPRMIVRTSSAFV